MALDSIQNKYLEGEGSPEGVIKGKKGFTYKDTLTNDEYASLGGDKWRKEVKGGVSLISRTYASFSDIDEDNLRNGERVYVKDTDSSYDFLFRNKKYIRTEKNASLNRNIAFVGNNDWNGFYIGDTVEIVFRIINIGTSGGINFLFNSGLTFGISITTQMTLTSRDSGGFDFELMNMLGEKENKLQLNKWFTLKATFLKDYPTVKKVDAPSTASWARSNFTIIDLESLKINQSGVFNIFEADNYNNSVLYNQDGTKQFNLSIVGDTSSATLQEPYIGDFTLDNEDISIVRKGDSFLKLNIVNKRISPQMLGYNDLSNDIGTDGNYVSDIINKIEESKYELYIPSGLYCLDKSINLFKPASYFWSGGDYDTSVRNITTAPKNRVTFYSHKNIDFFKIFSGGISIYGGSYDTTKVPYWEEVIEYNNKSLFPLDPTISGEEILSRNESLQKKKIYKDLSNQDIFMWDNATKDYILIGNRTLEAVNKRAIFRICTKLDNILSCNIKEPHFKGNQNAVNKEAGGFDGVLFDTSTLNPSKTGGSYFVKGDYVFEAASTVTSLDNGTIRLNNSNISDVTKLYISKTNNKGLTTGLVMSVLDKEDNFFRFRNKNGLDLIMFKGTSVTIDKGSYFEIEVTPYRYYENPNISEEIEFIHYYRNKEFHFSEMSVYGEYMDVLIRMSQQPNINPSGNLPSAMHSLQFKAWKSKQGLVHDGLTALVYLKDSLCQTAYLMSDNEINDKKRNTFVYTNGSLLIENLRLVDMGDGIPANGLYRNKYGFTNEGIAQFLGGQLSVDSPYVNSIRTLRNTNIIAHNNSNIVATLGGHIPVTSIITELDNILLNANKIGLTTTLNQFKNNGVDFENDVLDSTLNPNAELKSTKLAKDGIFKTGTTNYEEIQFDADYLNDAYTEIRITDFNNIMDAQVYSVHPLSFGFSLTTFIEGGFINKIQIIEEYQLGYIRKTKLVHNTSTNPFMIKIKHDAIKGNIISMTVRLIGSNINNLLFRINGMFMTISNKHTKLKPHLTTEGGQTVYGGMKMLGEFEPDSIKGTTPITTEDTLTTIALTTTGGNFCNMASANTNKTFTTTGDVLNAFAEVLVNRVDQPEITGATYKASKGVPFVASTDMIMRVENKGVPRGVVYWFEEV